MIEYANFGMVGQLLGEPGPGRTIDGSQHVSCRERGCAADQMRHQAGAQLLKESAGVAAFWWSKTETYECIGAEADLDRNVKAGKFHPPLNLGGQGWGAQRHDQCALPRTVLGELDTDCLAECRVKIR